MTAAILTHTPVRKTTKKPRKRPVKSWEMPDSDKPRLTLAQMRKRRVLSANELAIKAGLAASSVTRIEAGHIPRYQTIRRLADALGVTPEEILWPGDPLGLES